MNNSSLTLNYGHQKHSNQEKVRQCTGNHRIHFHLPWLEICLERQGKN